MSRSKKKPWIKDYNKGAKAISHRKFRRATNQALQAGKEPPVDQHEVMNQYDVCDYKIDFSGLNNEHKARRK